MQTCVYHPLVTVSEKDADYFRKKFAKNKVTNITSFHENDFVSTAVGKGDFILFHGNLSVAENVEWPRCRTGIPYS